MSRTPVREALVRLSAEGLVTTLPNRNTIVSAIDFAQLPVYFDALTLMYRVTTRLAALNRTREDLAAIRRYQADYAEAVERRDAIAMIQSNRDFHVAIAEAGGNPYYLSLFSRLLDEGRRILRIYYSSFDDKLSALRTA
jgi:DNA-binding GntR family transcriptional regulator